MILDTIQTDSEQIQRDVQRIKRLLESEAFFGGLQKHPSPLSPQWEPFTVTDPILAMSMIYSQQYWGQPEPWPYQYFCGELASATGRIAYVLVDKDRYERANEILYEVIDPFLDEVTALIEAKFNPTNIPDSVVGVSDIRDINLDKTEDKGVDLMTENAAAFLWETLQAVYLIGLDDAPFHARVLEAFEAGGLPCGWVGPVWEEGGDPEKSVRMFHLGGVDKR